MEIKLESQLKSLSVPGKLFEKIPDRDDIIQCTACAHYCKIKNKKSGICKVRYNQNGVLRVPSNYVAAIQCDPIEKKPFFHAYPNSLALSFGMLGCDYKCSFCQNWDISQTLRDPEAGRPPREITVNEIIESAQSLNARAVVSTYNEPLITSEWAIDIFKEAKKVNLSTGYVSNGNASKEVIDFIRPYTDLYKIDLKSFSAKNYRSMGGNLENVLRAIKLVHESGMWLEIVTLLIPGFNDSHDEIKQLTEFIADLSIDIPWHVTAYHKDYKMTDPSNTTTSDLLKAAEIGKSSGLRYIYPGNLHGQVGDWENTNCPNCNEVLIRRTGYHLNEYNITEEGRCPKCDEKIAGIWEIPKKRKRLFYFLK